MPSSSNDSVMRANLPRLEPLERRTLLASGFGSDGGDAAANALPAQLGGSMLFTRGNDSSSGGGFGVGGGGSASDDVNRLHAVVDVESQTAEGAIGGRLKIEGLGTFRFNGSATNGLAFFVFTGANGSGSMIVKRSASDAIGGGGGGGGTGTAADDDLSGFVSATINGVVTAGRVRLHSHGGTPATSGVGITPQASGASGGGDNTATTVGVFGGSVRFAGDTLGPTSSAAGVDTNRRRVHAVLHLDQDTTAAAGTTASTDAGLLSGTFRMDRIGRYAVTGAPFFGRTLIVFNGGTGSGALVLNRRDASAAAAGAFDGVRGKLFGFIGQMDLHALARLRLNSGATDIANGGALIDTDTGTGTNTGAETGTGTITGTTTPGIGGVGTGIIDTGIDTGIGTGIGTGTGTGTGIDIDTGAGSGTSTTGTGTNTGIGTGIGTGTGIDTGGTIMLP